MKRLALAASLLAFTGAALAMPADIPWDVYACKDGKGLKLKLLSDGLAVGIQITSTGADIDMTFAPEKEEEMFGFKDGTYKDIDGSDAVLVLKNELVTVTGKTVKDAPYTDCKATGEVIEPQ